MREETRQLNQKIMDDYNSLWIDDDIDFLKLQLSAKTFKLIDKYSHRHIGWMVKINGKQFDIYDTDRNEAIKKAIEKQSKIAQPIIL